MLCWISLAGPMARMLPRSIRMIRSAIRKALANSCVTTMMVREYAFLRFMMRSSMPAAMIGSRPADGSSKNRISGSIASARAMAARFFMPPLSCEGLNFRTR